MRISNYTINIANLKKIEDPEKEYSLCIRGKYGQTKLGEKTFGIKVAGKAWNSNKREIKPEYEKDYPVEVERLNHIKTLIPKVRERLSKGEIQWSTAIDILLEKPKKYDTDIMDFVVSQDLNETERSYRTYNNHISVVNTIQKKLINNGLEKYVPLNFDQLKDERILRDIHKMLMKDESLSKNTVHDYLEVLDTYYNEFTKEGRPFNDTGNKPPYSFKGGKQYVTYEALLIAVGKINTPQDLEAFLYWLYSFSLAGMDGQDLINIDEKKIVTEGYNRIDYYHQDFSRYSFPIHIKIRRGKITNKGTVAAPMQRIINTFPTLFIHKILKHLVAHNHPSFAYSGKDRLRIFNFYTKTEKYDDDRPGIDKWKKLRDTYYKKWKELIGEPISVTRQTYVRAGKSVGTSKILLDAELGHINEVSKAFRHYDSDEQKELDIIHLHALMNYDILQILRLILEKFYGRDKAGIPYLPELFKDEEERQYISAMLTNPLSLFSPEDEMELQKGLKRLGIGKPYIKEDGSTGFNQVPFDKYPKKIKELLDRKDNAIARHLDQDNDLTLPEALESSENKYYDLFLDLEELR